MLQRLRRVEASAGGESFSATHLRATLAQVNHILAELRPGMKQLILEDGKLVAERAAVATVEYLQKAEQHFKGSGQRLAIRESAMLDRAVKGTESSMLHRLEGDKKAGPGILQRYGDNVVKKFEERLQQRFIQKTPWSEVRAELIEKSPFLQEQPAFWAERIVRTEVMAAHGRAQWEGLREADAAVGGGMCKILVATFDSRTASDSYALHGQIRRPAEAFEDWTHAYQHPPNRPNDRETVVPHSLDWPIPAQLRWRSDGEVAARWSAEGRKGSPPPRPKMTTIPLERFASG